MHRLVEHCRRAREGGVRCGSKEIFESLNALHLPLHLIECTDQEIHTEMFPRGKGMYRPVGSAQYATATAPPPK